MGLRRVSGGRTRVVALSMVRVLKNPPFITEPLIKGRVVVSDRFLRLARVPKAGNGFGHFPHTETLFNPAGFSDGVFLCVI